VRGSAAGLITAILTAVVLFCLAGYQVTTETAGVRFEGRIGAALIELDRWLPAHRDDIELLSRDRPEAPLVLPDLPIEVLIPSSAVLEAPDETLQATIQRAMGEKLYAEGSGAVQDEEGKSHLGFAEPVRWSINLLGDDMHSTWRSVLILTVVLLLAVCAGMLWTRQSPLPSIAIGGVVAAVLSLGVWLLAQVMNTVLDGSVDKEIALVLRDGAWIGLRNGLSVAIIGAAATYLLSQLVRRRDRYDDWGDYDEPEYSYEAPRGRQHPPY
jgi:hypothetical protein